MKYIALVFVAFAVLSFVVWVAAAASRKFVFRNERTDPAFLGALMGAAGTIFAAVIAYVAVQRQIDQVELQSAENKAEAIIKQSKAIEEDIDTLTRTRKSFDDTLKGFRDFPAQTSEGYRDRLLEMRKKSLFNMNVSPQMARIAGGTGDVVRDYSFRMGLLINDVAGFSEMRFQAPPSIDRRDAEWQELNDVVRDRIQEGERVLKAIDAEVAAKKAEKEKLHAGTH